MVINQMIHGWKGACAGHSTRGAQHPVWPIIPPRIISGWRRELWAGNLIAMFQNGCLAVWPRCVSVTPTNL